MSALCIQIRLCRVGIDRCYFVLLLKVQAHISFHSWGECRVLELKRLALEFWITFIADVDGVFVSIVEWLNKILENLLDRRDD